MDFKFSEEEELFRRTVRDFYVKNIAPRWIEIDEAREGTPVDLIKKMGQQGLFCIPVREEHGGMGGTFTMAVIAVDEMGYYDPSIGVPVYALLCNGWPMLLDLYGTDEAKSEILPRVAAGDGFFGIATTEPQGGSDIAGTKVTARKKNGKWILNGEKAYISGVKESLDLPWGGGYFLIARSGAEEAGHRSLTTFAFLEKKDGEVVRGFEPTYYEDVGRAGISCGGFMLNDVELDDKYRIGEENKGFYLTMEGFNVARILVAAAAIGSARWALDQAKEWFRVRKLFGRHVSSFQGVNFKFAELYARLEAARLVIYKAAWLADQIYIHKNPAHNARDLNVLASMAKMMGPEVAVDIYEEVMKWHGAYGYSKECPVFRGWLGTFSYVIGAEGAQNIMRYIIARDVIGTEYVRPG